MHETRIRQGRRRFVHGQSRFGEPRKITVEVPRLGRHRVITGRDGMRWLVVRSWYGPVAHRVPVVGYW
ncbi:hypothetical protein ACQP2U_43760 (plasmid) [Nocardia sp. CA-084685]|uniref:hypothetical protein n=1 Tax=Nocardia sp. CA-084685 TaxID=3239970 RepID=UPI003D99965A